MRGKYLLEAAGLYLATIFAVYNRRQTVDSEKDMKTRAWYTARKGKPDKQAITALRAQRIAAVDPKYELGEEFKKTYQKQTWVR